MQKYDDVVQNLNGTAMPGVVIQVTLAFTSTPATIFSDPAGTTAIDVLRTDNLGQFEFYAPNGRYDVFANVNGARVAHDTDTLIYDPEDDTRVTSGGAGTGGTGGGGGGGTGTGNRSEVLLTPDSSNVITPDGALSNRFRFQLTADTKIANPVNFGNDEHIFFTGYQDAAGGHRLTFGLGLLLPDAQPYVPPAGGKAAFTIEMRPTTNINSNSLNWTVMGYPDKSVSAGFASTTEFAYIGATGYFSLGAAYPSLVNGGTLRIIRNGKGQEATATKFGVAGENYLIAGVPVPANGVDQRPLLQLGLSDYGTGGGNRPTFAKALLNFEAQGTFTVRDIRIAHVRNATQDSRGICANDQGANLILQNVELFDCNNGVLTGNSSACGDTTMTDVRIDSCGIGGPTGETEFPNSSGYTHGTYFGHNNSVIKMTRCTITNAPEGDNLKSRSRILIIDQVLCQNATNGRELEFPNGGVLRATNCIFSRTFTSGGINNLTIIGNNPNVDGAEGIDTSRPREYIFRNCRFEHLLNVPGRDPHFIACTDPGVSMQFIDCEFIGEQAKANQITPDDTLYTGCATTNGIRYKSTAPPVFTLTGGPIGPLLPVGYFPVPMTPIV